jgi:hypothetical protein
MRNVDAFLMATFIASIAVQNTDWDLQYLCIMRAVKRTLPKSGMPMM